METDLFLSADRACEMPSGAGLLARDGAVLALSPRMIDVLGGAAACRVGAPLGDLVAAPDRGLVEATLEDLRSGREMRTELSLRLRADSASDRPVRLVLEAVRDRGETVAVIFDDAKAAPIPVAAEATRGDAERTLHLLSLAAGQGGVVPWFLDLATGRFEDNAALCGLFGWPEDGLPPDFDALMDRIHSGDRRLARRVFEGLVSGKQPKVSADLRIRHRDGHWVRCRTVASLRQDAGAAAPLVCGVTRDIGAAVEDEARLACAPGSPVSDRNAGREISDVPPGTIKGSGAVPWYRVPQTGAGRIGAALSMRLGYGDDFTIDAETLRAITHPEDLARAQSDDARLVAGEIDTFAHDLRLRRADGTWCWFAARGRAPDRSAGDLPRLVCGSFTEIDRLEADEHCLAAAAAEIRHAHDRLNALADNFPGALFEFNVAPDGTYRFPYTSAKFADIMGVDQARFEKDGAAVFSVIHPDDLAEVLETARTAVRETRPVRLEVRVAHREKGPRWLMTSASPIREDDGSVTWYGTLLDITEQKQSVERAAQAAAAVRVEQARLKTLAENAPCALFEYRFDETGFAGFGYYSSRFPEMFGVTRAALESDPAAFRRYVPAEDLEAVQAAIAEGARNLEPVSVTHRIRHPEKGLRWVLSTGTPVKLGDGSVTIYSSILDVTKRTIAERAVAEAADALRETNARFLRLADNAPGALFEHRCFADGGEALHFVSSSLLDILGVAPCDVQADAANLFARVVPDDRERVLAAMACSARTQERLEMTLRVLHPEKGERWVLVAVETLLETDGGSRGFGSVLDVTERLETERRAAQSAAELARAHERLTYLTEGATVGLFEVRLTPDGRFDLPYTSARFNDLFGYTRAQIDALGDGIEERVHAEDLSRVRAAIEKSARETGPFQMRFRVSHPAQGTIWLKASAGRPVTDKGVLTWVAALEDVTTDVKREQDLRQAHRIAEQMRLRNEQQALHDGLTGLANRTYFDDVIADRAARAKSGGAADCTLVRLDLDRFKHVNDTLGHAAGDKVLVRVAEVLRDSVRVGDFASRNGGDEFSILMAPGATEEQAREVVGRVQRKLAEPLIHDGRQCRFGVSFGIAHSDNILETGDDIHLFADAALHRAKTEGGNRTEAFTPRLHFEIHRDRSLAIAIHEALENDELVPYFQPQLRASDGGLFGAEVLLRWNHPTDGIIAPGAFMHVAEHLRLVPDIDRIVMEKSCDVLSRWRARGLVVPKISFNVSSGRMHDPDLLAFASRFAEIDTKVTFELLESILVEEENQAFRDNLNIIRDAGVDIEIDDFGSGHASIIGLMEIEPSALKIDQRIVFPVVRDRRARDLVRAIVEIADALGINTVAEGVETEAHVRILREIGCGVLQGYHYAKPLSETHFLDYARALGDPVA